MTHLWDGSGAARQMAALPLVQHWGLRLDAVGSSQGLVGTLQHLLGVVEVAWGLCQNSQQCGRTPCLMVACAPGLGGRLRGSLELGLRRMGQKLQAQHGWEQAGGVWVDAWSGKQSEG